MSDQTIFQNCSATFPNDVNSVLECVSNGATAEKDDVAAGLNSFFLVWAGALVFFMQPGFAMLCAGSIRAKNAKNVILWNLLDSCGGGLAYWAVGYAFSYGGDSYPGGKTFVGTQGFFLQGDTIALEFWFFEFAFACALSSIVAGTIAERTQMKAYLLYSLLLPGFVYPVVAHAYWSTHGWLSLTAEDPLWGSGIVDLAGSGPVHMCGGVAALMGGIILGPRIGRFTDENGNRLDKPKDFPPHSVSLQFLGTFCLWFGWYGFNPGSVLTINSENRGQVCALVAANTTLAACSAAMSAMLTGTLMDYYYFGYHTYDTTYAMNGCLTGLVAITAPCASVETWAAVLIGIVAGWIYLGASKLMIRLRIDDAVDAIPVHMFGGAWGDLSAGLFSSPSLMLAAYNTDKHVGWFYEWGRGSGNFTLMGTQICGVLFIFGWTSTVMGLFFYFLNYMGWFRIDALEEEVGMDISRHKGSAYDIQAADDDNVKQLETARLSLVEDRSEGRNSKKSDEATKNGMPSETVAAEVVNHEDYDVEA